MSTARYVVTTLTWLWAASARADVPRFEFVGNRALSNRELRGAIALVFQDDSIAFDELVRRDLLTVLGAYYDRGYLEAKLAAPSVDSSTNTVTVAVREGRQFKVSAVEVTGDVLGDERAQLAKLAAHPNVAMSRTMVARDCLALAEEYEDLGYAFVDVEPMAKFDAVHATADLQFYVRRGPLVRVESVTIVGNHVLRDEQIRKLLTFSVGDQFNLTRVLASKRRLLAVPSVKDVVVAVERASGPDHAVVVIEITEVPTTRI